MNRPALSIATCFDYAIPIEVQMPAIAAAGFSHVSLGGREEHSGYLTAAGRERLNTLVQRNGLMFDTIHAPCSMELPDSAQRLTAVAEAAAALGVPIVVVHAGPFEIDASEQSSLVDKIFDTGRKLEVVSRKTGISFAIENVLPGPATELSLTAMSQLDPACFGFCYDSSHDQIDGPNGFELLDRLKGRLIAVHLSDRIAEFVDHVPPREGFIDWTGLVHALSQTGYDNPLLFEVFVTHSSVKEIEPFLALAYRRAYEIHRMLASALS